MASVSVVIPAFNEAGRVGETVRALREALPARGWANVEILVIDDGSTDATTAEAEGAGARVIRLDRNRGKGAALTVGLDAARGELLLLADADLAASAGQLVDLLPPIDRDAADMTIAVLPALGGGGFGLVRSLARWGLRRAGCAPLAGPLSGQRALRRSAWEAIGHLDDGFGIEMGLNLDAARHELRVQEVPVALSHRVTGKDWAGFVHRGRQFVAILRSLARRGWLNPLRRSRRR